MDTTIHWRETAERVGELRERFRLVPRDRAGRFEVRDREGTPRGELRLPLVLGDFALDEEMPAELGPHWILLIQAGAAGLGVWSDEGLLRHKVIKKYVVRGKGRAQTLHVKTRGKSRYGSRLRLQNAERLLIEINEKLIAWRKELGEPDLIFTSCPVRTWPELFQREPPPPFDQRDARLVKVPLDVRVPSFEELQRVQRFLERGRIALTEPERP